MNATKFEDEFYASKENEEKDDASELLDILKNNDEYIIACTSKYRYKNKINSFIAPYTYEYKNQIELKISLMSM